MKGSDSMLVEILDDGTLKVSIDAVSSANHGSAEKLLAETIRTLGADVKTTHKHGGRAHTHSHSHNHHVKQ